MLMSIVAHLSFHQKDAIHFQRSRRPILSTDNAASFAEARRDVQQQIVCLAFLGCSLVLQSRIHPTRSAFIRLAQYVRVSNIVTLTWVKGEDGQAWTPDHLPRDVTAYSLNQIILRRHNMEFSSAAASNQHYSELRGCICRSQAAPKATTATICYPHHRPQSRHFGQRPFKTISEA
jgi:hypothetical protein